MGLLLKQLSNLHVQRVGSRLIPPSSMLPLGLSSIRDGALVLIYIENGVTLAFQQWTRAPLSGPAQTLSLSRTCMSHSMSHGEDMSPPPLGNYTQPRSPWMG